ncbi:hypothetical protein F5Y09DRAFT_309652 [Xylaria sp. FL1042]|nr:hypothetical protein F5Y09DRAFT_309652 [Xylaria sp. FL1042]
MRAPRLGVRVGHLEVAILLIVLSQFPIYNHIKCLLIWFPLALLLFEKFVICYDWRGPVEVKACVVLIRTFGAEEIGTVKKVVPFTRDRLVVPEGF